MNQSVSISASGPAFTFLLYENLKNDFGQEGFLLGDIIEKQTKAITDNDQEQTYITKVIRVNAVMPCPATAYFYNGVGKIDTVKLKAFLGDLQHKVIAWYKYKPSSSFTLTFREKMIHRQLSDFFSIPRDLFTICLLLSECSKNGSTHSFQQSFLRNKINRYEPIPFHIVNLTDKKNCYKSAEPSSASFQAIIDKLKHNTETVQGVNFISKLQQSIQEHMKSVVSELAIEEMKLFKLEEDIKEVLSNEKDRKNKIINCDDYDENELLCENEDKLSEWDASTGTLTPNETVKIDRRKKNKGVTARKKN